MRLPSSAHLKPAQTWYSGGNAILFPHNSKFAAPRRLAGVVGKRQLVQNNRVRIVQHAVPEALEVGIRNPDVRMTKRLADYLD